MACRVLFVDDDKALRVSTVQWLQLSGFDVAAAENAKAAFAMAAADAPDVVVSDVRMPGADGLSVLRHFTELDPTLPWDGQTHNLDLRMGMKFGNTDVSVFGSNLSDEHPVFNRNRPMMEPPPADLYRAMTVRPRTFGVTVLYRY